MTASHRVEDLLACLLALQQACVRGARSAIEQRAASCHEAASRLVPADLVECDRQAFGRLRLTADATLEFLRRAVRDRGARLTTLRFRQFE